MSGYRLPYRSKFEIKVAADLGKRKVAFEYEKVKYTKIKAHKILRKIPKEVSTVLVIEGLNFRVAVSRPPPRSFEWALMMYLDKYPWRIFGYSDEKLPDSRRKI